MGPKQEQDQGADRESEEGAGVVPSSPEEWLESPTEEGSGLSPGEGESREPPGGACRPHGAGTPASLPRSVPPGGVSPDSAASGQTSPSTR